MIDFYEHIGAYKTGKLEGEMLSSFEAELSKNAELQAAVDNHDVVEELLDLMYEDELRGVLSEESIDVISTKKIDPVDNVKKMPYLRWMSIAAILVALIAVGFLFKDQLFTPSNEDLFANYMSPYMGTAVRGETVDDNTISTCDQGHYFLDKGEVAKAQALFIDDLQNGASACNDKSEWYLCLIYLKNGDELNRDKLLNKIIQSDRATNKYYDKAIKLHADLK